MGLPCPLLPELVGVQREGQRSDAGNAFAFLHSYNCTILPTSGVLQEALLSKKGRRLKVLHLLSQLQTPLPPASPPDPLAAKSLGCPGLPGCLLPPLLSPAELHAVPLPTKPFDLDSGVCLVLVEATFNPSCLQKAAHWLLPMRAAVPPACCSPAQDDSQGLGHLLPLLSCPHVPQSSPNCSAWGQRCFAQWEAGWGAVCHSSASETSQHGSFYTERGQGFTEGQK